MMTWQHIIDELLSALAPLKFSAPVTHVYNPLQYAQAPYRQYLRHYGGGRKEALLVGMNPGPWGMAQTGIPFGEVRAVTEWLQVQAPVGAPADMHPQRPVMGFHCHRSEVSGRRLWGWARKTFQTPERFFARFLVVNYCPLMFIEANGKNRTPDKLSAAEQRPMLAACDQALVRIIQKVEPTYVFGVGNFAAAQVRRASAGRNMVIGTLTHPSPANPKANRGWEALIEKELSAAGLMLSGAGA